MKKAVFILALLIAGALAITCEEKGYSTCTDVQYCNGTELAVDSLTCCDGMCATTYTAPTPTPTPTTDPCGSDDYCNTTCTTDPDCKCDDYAYEECGAGQYCSGDDTTVGNLTCCDGECKLTATPTPSPTLTPTPTPTPTATPTLTPTPTKKPTPETWASPTPKPKDNLTATPTVNYGTCVDGKDNDFDGLTDKEDPDCYDEHQFRHWLDEDTRQEPPPEPEGNCNDGEDNDDDGAVDAHDKDCYDATGRYRPANKERIQQQGELPIEDQKLTDEEEEKIEGLVSPETEQAILEPVEHKNKGRYAVEFDRGCHPWRAEWANVRRAVVTDRHYFAVVEIPMRRLADLIQDECVLKVGDESGIERFLEEAHRKIREETQERIRQEKLEETHEDIEDFEFVKLEVERLAEPKIGVGQISGFQTFVTPDDAAVIAQAAGLSAEEIYYLVQGWTWVSDPDLHGEEEKWLYPDEYIGGTPGMAGNPLPGEIVSDCSEQANTLASMLRTVLGPGNVRVAIGMVNFSGVVGGHAWVEVLDPEYGLWFVLDPTNGPYYSGGTKVARAGLDYDYWKTHPYPFVASEVYAYYNDQYFTQIGGDSNAPDEWQVAAVITLDAEISGEITKQGSTAEEGEAQADSTILIVAAAAIVMMMAIVGGGIYVVGLGEPREPKPEPPASDEAFPEDAPKPHPKLDFLDEGPEPGDLKPENTPTPDV